MPLTLRYWRDEPWYVGQLVEFPNVFSQGETLEELEEMIRDAYELMEVGPPLEAPLSLTLSPADGGEGTGRSEPIAS
jgi:predicted RNase H-like HicB family nuclease